MFTLLAGAVVVVIQVPSRFSIFFRVQSWVGWIRSRFYAKKRGP